MKENRNNYFYYMLTIKKLCKKFGAKVKEYREELGISQVDLAAKINVEPATVSRIESGKAYVSSTVLCRLCNVFNLEPIKLFDFKGIYLKEDAKKDKIKSIESSLNNSSYSQLDFLNSIIELMKNNKFK